MAGLIILINSLIYFYILDINWISLIFSNIMYFQFGKNKILFALITCLSLFSLFVEGHAKNNNNLFPVRCVNIKLSNESLAQFSVVLRKTDFTEYFDISTDKIKIHLDFRIVDDFSNESELSKQMGRVVFAKEWISKINFEQNNLIENFIELKQNIKLVKGNYRITGYIQALNSKNYYSNSYYFNLNHKQEDDDAPLSDILITYSKEKKSIFSVQNILPEGIESINYEIQSLINREGPHLIRIVMYHRDPEFQGKFAQRFLWEKQFRKVVYTGFTSISGTVDLKDIPFGEHLLEIYLLEEGKIVAQKSTSFKIIWSGLKDITENPKLMFEKMKPILSAQTSTNWSRLNSEELTQKMNQFWMIHGDPNAESALEEYFLTVEACEKKFNENTQLAILSDRSRIFLQFGPPSNENNIVINGKNKLVWEYRRYHLRFTFRQQGDKWIIEDL